jgi:hypothetical protein
VDHDYARIAAIVDQAQGFHPHLAAPVCPLPSPVSIKEPS